jgi:hypothetical protein
MRTQETKLNQSDSTAPKLPESGLARTFIMQHQFASFGPDLEELLRDGLVKVGFKVARCSCLETHPVVHIRLRGQPELKLGAVKQCIRKLAKALGYRAPSDGMAITVRAGGTFDGAFTLETEFAPFPCSELPV